MMRFGAAVVILLAACSSPPRPPLPPGAPIACAEGGVLPRAPAKPRTVEQLGQWATQAAHAATVSERARTDCALAYSRLRTWILDGSQ
jgi:hypothetical protein